MPKRPPGRPRGDQRWSTFPRNHARAIVACDFFVAVTATFRLFYVLVLIEHGSRRLMHFNITNIRPRPGRCSNCGRRSAAETLTDTFSTIATASSRQTWMRRLAGWG